MSIDPEFENDVLSLLLEENDTCHAAASRLTLESTNSGTESTFLDDITLKMRDEVDVQASKRKHESNSSIAAQYVDKHRNDRELKRQRNSGDLEPQKKIVRDPNAPYDVLHTDKKNIAEGEWLADQGLVELITLRGNFWRIMGFTQLQKQLLNPEEALLLVEKSQLIVRPKVRNASVSGSGTDSTSQVGVHSLAFGGKAAKANTPRIPAQHFYQEVLQFVPLACMLTYDKLKSYDYITLRHRRHNGNVSHPLKAFSCDAEVYAHMRAHPKQDILETLVSFDIYANLTGWTKKGYLDITNVGDPAKRPHGHVVVQTGAWTMNSRVVSHLLAASKGVPIIFAAVLPSGNLILEEFTDARTSLTWSNDLAIDITFFSKVSLATLVPGVAAAGDGKLRALPQEDLSQLDTEQRPEEQQEEEEEEKEEEEEEEEESEDEEEDSLHSPEDSDRDSDSQEEEEEEED
jgi:hypothetical protein